VKQGELDVFRREKRYVHKQGHTIWAELSVSVVRDSEGAPSYLITEIQDITKRKEAREQLAAYARRLAASNEELKNFAHVASHDLRSPLRGISSMCGLLERKFAPELPAKAQEYLQIIIGSAKRMDELIQDVLSLSTVTHEAIDFRNVDLNVVVHGVVSDLKWTTQATGAQLHIDRLPTIEADEMQMRQLFQNLIGNALKYQRPDATPVVAVQSQMLPGGESCQITVQDNGVGFDPAQADRIFQPFQRLHSRSEFEGSGIGLAICAKVVHRYGGTITAQSTLGEGSTFKITLPIRQQFRQTEHTADNE
jgi:light-regulated signal transduction histidine kinase (bacteriophytochrome)